MEIFHDGEIAVQELVGERDRANSVGRVISKIASPNSETFINARTEVIVSSVDDHDNIWVSILYGNKGFITFQSQEVISISRNQLEINDVFFKNILKNTNIGCLFIELATRKRYRVNGIVIAKKDSIDLCIKEAYPNCPNYINKRKYSHAKSCNLANIVIKDGTQLNMHCNKIIGNSDTFFIGSKSNKNSLDTSHRGGAKGFVEINNNTLKIPDFRGNSLFNTLGNIHQNSKAGLLFIDFKSGDTLQLTGKSTLLFDQHSDIDMLKTNGTGRFLLFEVEEWILKYNK